MKSADRHRERWGCYRPVARARRSRVDSRRAAEPCAFRRGPGALRIFSPLERQPVAALGPPLVHALPPYHSSSSFAPSPSLSRSRERPSAAGTSLAVHADSVSVGALDFRGAPRQARRHSGWLRIGIAPARHLPRCSRGKTEPPMQHSEG